MEKQLVEEISDGVATLVEEDRRRRRVDAEHRQLLWVGVGEAEQTCCRQDQPFAPTERVERDQDPPAT